MALWYYDVGVGIMFGKATNKYQNFSFLFLLFSYSTN